MDDEILRVALAKAIAASTAVELLTFSFLASQPEPVRSAFLQTMRSAKQDIGPPGNLSFEAAEFMADTRVQAAEALEALVARIEGMIAQAQA